ncbi:MAG: P-loop NTPase fold protein [Chloroflexi bacterium]|nr:P-loop NTPase fold protein [Chloroflexota bacterium]
MVTESVQKEAGPALPPLKVEEAKINVVTPWTDDELDRQKIANRLTKVIEDQEAPFVISLDGRWGTGKTFLLKRWRQELQNKQFQAIYFNAWEDDFCDDPLLSIIGQLSEHFEDGKFKDVALNIAGFGVGLLTKQLTGTAVDFTDLKPESILDGYHRQRRTKEQLKAEIQALAAKVKRDSGKPLVFIIDELDRCRPTFAIELLERVKHIFDVPNIVFVFGLNRAELTKSVQSIYGNIEASVYLRRFFDMEFVLPEVNPEKFCLHLLQRYDLWPHFRDSPPVIGINSAADEYSAIAEQLHQFFGQLGLSLRDMDYCLRVLALATRGLAPGRTLFPYALVALISTKIANIELYRGFMSGEVAGAAIIDYIYERQAPVGEGRARWLGDNDATRVWIEAAIYCIDDFTTITQKLSSNKRSQNMGKSAVLSQRARQNESQEFVSWILERMQSYRDNNSRHLLNRNYIAGLIELYAQPDAY